MFDRVGKMQDHELIKVPCFTHFSFGKVVGWFIPFRFIIFFPFFSDQINHTTTFVFFFIKILFIINIIKTYCFLNPVKKSL